MSKIIACPQSDREAYAYALLEIAQELELAVTELGTVTEGFVVPDEVAGHFDHDAAMTAQADRDKTELAAASVDGPTQTGVPQVDATIDRPSPAAPASATPGPADSKGVAPATTTSDTASKAG